MPFDAGSPPGIDRAAKGPDPPNEGLQPDRPKDDSRSGKMLPPQSIEENEALPTKESIRGSTQYTLSKHNEVVSSISCRSTNSEVQMLS